MSNGESEMLLKNIEELKVGMDIKTEKKLNLELLERSIKRLDSFIY